MLCPNHLGECNTQLSCPDRVDHGSLSTIMSRATLALLFFLWPSTSARYGLKTHCTFRAELLQSPQYSLRTSATIRVHRKWRTDHTQARANGGGCLTQVISLRSFVGDSVNTIETLIALPCSALLYFTTYARSLEGVTSTASRIDETRLD